MPSNTTAYDPAAYPPSQTALMFLDYENILVSMVPSPTKETLIKAAETLLSAARKHNIAILHCLSDTSLNPPPTNKASATWDAQFKPIFSANPELGAEYAAFAPASDGAASHETVHTRLPGLRSVLQDDVVLYLRRRGINHLVLAGIATSGAIMGTMSHGTDINFVVTVVADACWDPTAQVHADLIDTVIPSLAYVSSAEQAVAYFSG
ncbi:Isochorismatase hydrolase [Nemania sp. FL0916]|nr:Isochorismatase hydrolase [Nemania sp. FL0916]